MPPTPITPTVGYSGSQTRYVTARDVSNGYDLYTLNQTTSFNSFASLTKLMTVYLILVYKQSVLDTEAVTLSTADCTQPYSGVTETAAGFGGGDITTWRGILYGILLPSGFEGCQTAARLLGSDGHGTGGTSGFITLMNSTATALGMSSTTYYDSFGNGVGFGSIPNQNTSTSHDLTIIANAAFGYTDIRNIASTPSFSLTVTGSNPRTLSWNHFSRFINGPTNNQSGISDTNVFSAKDGVWNESANHYSMCVLWKSPGGTFVIFTMLNATSLYEAMLDVRGMMYSIVRDFPYLDDGRIPGDLNFTSVKCLVGFDGSYTDESNVGRTLTNTSTTLGNPVIYKAGTSKAAHTTSDSQVVTTPDASDIRVAGQDFTAEIWWYGDPSNWPGGSGGQSIWFSKTDDPTNQREWLVNYLSGDLQLFASTNGTTYSSAIAFGPLTTPEANTFGNGAPRHIALVKKGSTWTMYVNGEAGTSTLSIATAFAGTGALSICNYANAASYSPHGAFDEFRLTMGLARYTPNMVTLDPRRFPRSAITVPLDTIQQQQPVQNALQFGQSQFGPSTSARPSYVFPLQSVQAIGPIPAVVIPQVDLKPFPNNVIFGPWYQTLFNPIRILDLDHLLAPPLIRSDVQVPPIGVDTVSPGPWNQFGRLTIFQGGPNLGPSPIPPPPPGPPPPPPFPVGLPTNETGNIPRSPDVTDKRLRGHLDKVSDMLNSLSDQGFIQQVKPKQFKIIGSGFTAPRNPTPQDDASVGVPILAHFLNTLDNSVWICVNNSVGSAVWRRLL